MLDKALSEISGKRMKCLGLSRDKPRDSLVQTTACPILYSPPVIIPMPLAQVTT